MSPILKCLPPLVVRSSNSQLVSFDRCQGLKPGLVSSTCSSSITIASVQYILQALAHAAPIEPLFLLEVRHHVQKAWSQYYFCTFFDKPITPKKVSFMYSIL